MMVDLPKQTYENTIGTFRKLGHSVVFRPCINCDKGQFMHLYYADNNETYRTCDICYMIEKLN